MTHHEYQAEPWEAVQWLIQIDDRVQRAENDAQKR